MALNFLVLKLLTFSLIYWACFCSGTTVFDGETGFGSASCTFGAFVDLFGLC